jgi:hypothetical protein
MFASACGPVAGSADGGSDHGDTTRDPETGVDAVSMSSFTTVPSSTADDDGPADAPIPDFWDPGQRCPRTFEVVPLPGDVAVIVDVSQTMATGLVDADLDAATPPVTRWSMLADALDGFLLTLAMRDAVALWTFPRFDAAAPPSLGACEIAEAHPGFDAPAADLVTYLPIAEADFFLGATPMTGALSQVTLELADRPATASRHVVVVTDGAPNCAAGAEAPGAFDEVDPGARAWIEDALTAGITTHVVAVAVPEGTYGGGVEGDVITDHRAALADLAQAGGTALQLAADADGLVRTTASCRLPVPIDLQGWLFVVRIGDDPEYYEIGSEQCADEAGFVYVAPGDPSVIELCAAACDSLFDQGVATLVESCVIAE